MRPVLRKSMQNWLHNLDFSGRSPVRKKPAVEKSGQKVGKTHFLTRFTVLLTTFLLFELQKCYARHFKEDIYSFQMNAVTFLWLKYFRSCLGSKLEVPFPEKFEKNFCPKSAFTKPVVASQPNDLQ